MALINYKHRDESYLKKR